MDNILKVERYFTKDKSENIYDSFDWEKIEVGISDDSGKLLFVQKDVEFPKFWSALARKITASKYFFGEHGTNEREKSLKQLISRIASTFKEWGLKQRYFSDEDANNFERELSFITTNQMMAFNSPVWFNVGVHKISKYENKEQKEVYILNQYGEPMLIPIGKEREYPQTSACFIQSVEDTMESIMDLAKKEAMLFKYGSGTGSNISSLRSSKERLSGGGRPSGPLAYWQFWDKVAGIVKSGGKTRRAAKMDILNIEHPDILEFIESKKKEEEKMHILIDNGIDWRTAQDTVSFQNTNISVRATDNFMKAVEEDSEWQTIPVHNKEMADKMPKFKARLLMRKIAEATHFCGDPGMQFHDNVNRWHTCPNTGEIRASNPCVTGDTRILTKDGRWKRIDSLIDKKTEIVTNTGFIENNEIEGSFKTGRKPVYKLTTKDGYELKLTADHKVFTVNRGFVQACELTKDDFLLIPNSPVAEISKLDEKDRTFFQMLGVYFGDGGSGKINGKRGIPLSMNREQEKAILQKFAESVAINYERTCHKNSPAMVQITPTSCKYVITNTLLQNRFLDFVDLNKQSHEKCFSENIFNLGLSEQKYILQGLFTADGTVANYGEKSQYIALDSSSLQLLKDAQIMLLGFGIKSKIYLNRRAGKNIALLPDGKGGMKKYPVKEMHSLRISRDSRIKFQKYIGFMEESPKQRKLVEMNKNVATYKDLPIECVSSLEYLGEEEVYDLTEPITHTFVANGITIHNCSEYMSVDNSSCNLASINLMRFMKEDNFEIENFKNVVRITAIAQDLEFDNSCFPTKEIAENSHKLRPLGMGYANLGSLLIFLGLPYDSDEARNVAAVITALMTGKVYETSTELAEKVGCFKEFYRNKEPMMKVMRMHREALNKIDKTKLPSNFNQVLEEAVRVWENVILRGERYGFRNAQATVLAPTGTIGFMMDADTKGIEPEIGLVQFKLLSDGGILKLVNGGIEKSLRRLGYSDNNIREIIEYIEKNESIEGAPGLKEEHVAIFDCANKPKNGKRTIHYQGHIRMMAAVQPFLSGAISKTVNLPSEATIDEIEKVYMESWKLGLKAVALYRDGSKRIQPLNFSNKNKEKEEKKEVIEVPLRKKLPITRASLTHKFRISNHEGYLIFGLYENGLPGELFINMSKEGSTIGGLMDIIGTLVSISLQYGVPIEDLIKKFKHQKFEPRGIVFEGHEEIKTAESIIDYIGQFMEAIFVKNAGKNIVKADMPIRTNEDNKKITNFVNTNINMGEPGGFCNICGTQMIKKGKCVEECPSCHYQTQSGCGG